jgi:hypothetical protein
MFMQLNDQQYDVCESKILANAKHIHTEKVELRLPGIQLFQQVCVSVSRRQ